MESTYAPISLIMKLSVDGRIAHDALEAKEAITGIFRTHAKWRSRSKYIGSKAVASSTKASITPKASQNAACSTFSLGFEDNDRISKPD